MADFEVGDEVVYQRTVSTWSRQSSETVYGVVIAVTPKRVRIRLTSGIKNSPTAFVDKARLTKLEVDSTSPSPTVAPNA